MGLSSLRAKLAELGPKLRIFGASSGLHQGKQRRRKVWVEDDSPAPFFAKGQQLSEPIRCERCGQKPHLMDRTPDITRPRFELRMFECKCGHYTRRAVKS